MVIKRLRAEVRRLRDEVDFLSNKRDAAGSDEDSLDEEERGTLPQRQREEFEAAVQKYIQDPDPSSHLDFCGGITLPKIRALCSMFKAMLKNRREKGARDEDEGSNDEQSSEAGSASVSSNESQTRSESTNRRQAKLRQSHGEHRNPERRKAESRDNMDAVCGVPTCRDQHVLDEPNAAFTWFKENYPGLSVIDKNKMLLKTKYAEAKNAGKRIDEIRSRISHHKEAIAKVRKAYAISMVSSSEEKMSEYSFKADEKAHTDAIDREKTAYKETLDHLRGLKGTIENTQKVVEKGRRQLQSDFDSWYQHSCYKGNRQQDVRLRKERMTKNADEPGSTPCRHIGNEESQSTHGSSASTVGQKPVDRMTGESKQTTSEAPGPSEFKLPEGIQLTGNADADADIIAFYRAKEILLGRR